MQYLHNLYTIFAQYSFHIGTILELYFYNICTIFFAIFVQYLHFNCNFFSQKCTLCTLYSLQLFITSEYLHDVCKILKYLNIISTILFIFSLLHMCPIFLYHYHNGVHIIDHFDNICKIFIINE